MAPPPYPNVVNVATDATAMRAAMCAAAGEARDIMPAAGEWPKGGQCPYVMNNAVKQGCRVDSGHI